MFTNQFGQAPPPLFDQANQMKDAFLRLSLVREEKEDDYWRYDNMALWHMAIAVRQYKDNDDEQAGSCHMRMTMMMTTTMRHRLAKYLGNQPQ